MENQSRIFIKIFSAIAKGSIAAYALGFLITNSYFSDYGFVAPEITSPVYYKSGVLFLIIFSIIASSFYICHSHLRKYRLSAFGFVSMGVTAGICILFAINPEGNRPVYIWSFLAGLFLWLCLPILEIKISNRIVKIMAKGLFVIVPLIFASIYCSSEFSSLVVVEYLIIAIICVYYSIEKLASPASPGSILLILILFVLSTWFFGKGVYPIISSIKGGGAPLKANLILSNSEKEVDFSSQYGISQNNVAVLYQTADSVFVVPFDEFGAKSAQAVEIYKEYLYGVQYLKYDRSELFHNRQK